MLRWVVQPKAENTIAFSFLLALHRIEFHVSQFSNSAIHTFSDNACSKNSIGVNDSGFCSQRFQNSDKSTANKKIRCICLVGRSSGRVPSQARGAHRGAAHRGRPLPDAQRVRRQRRVPQRGRTSRVLLPARTRRRPVQPVPSRRLRLRRRVPQQPRVPQLPLRQPLRGIVRTQCRLRGAQPCRHLQVPVRLRWWPIHFLQKIQS